MKAKLKYLWLPVFIPYRLMRAPMWWISQKRFKDWNPNFFDVALTLITVACTCISAWFLLIPAAVALLLLGFAAPVLNRNKNDKSRPVTDTQRSDKPE